MPQSSLLRVLHADDEQLMHRNVALLLKPLGFIIDHAFSVGEAQAALRQASLTSVTPYHLVITDGDLGGAAGETGLDLLIHVRANYAGTPVITFSTQKGAFWGILDKDMSPELQHVSKLKVEKLLPAVKRALGLP